MKLRKSKIEQIKTLCSEISEDDGMHPNEIKKKYKLKKRKDYKAEQLSKQAERALILGWQNAVGSTLLSDLFIESVTPDPTGAKLIITIVLTSECNYSEKEVLQRLKRERGNLRSSIAQAIHRKKVPELSFRVIPHKEVV